MNFCVSAWIEKEGSKSIEVRLEAAIAELEAALDHGFRRPELLVRALTHRSLANERAANAQTPVGDEPAKRTRATMSAWSF